MVREIVGDSGWSNLIPAGHSRTVEKYVFRLYRSCQVRFGQYSGKAVPVEHARAAGGLLYTVAIAVIGVRGSDASLGNTGNPVLWIVDDRNRIAGVAGHIACSVIVVASQLIANGRADSEVFCRAFRDRLLHKIAPRVIAVAVAPIFCLAVCGHFGAVGAGSLG